MIAALLVTKCFQYLLVAFYFVPIYPCTSIPCTGTGTYSFSRRVYCTSNNGLVIVQYVAMSTGNIKTCCSEYYAPPNKCCINRHSQGEDCCCRSMIGPDQAICVSRS